MQDIVEVIKNLQTLSENNNAFKVLKDFERVLDELDMYVFENWREGELVAGPKVNRYTVECSFMWPREEPPNLGGAKRLNEYGCKVTYAKENILIPRQIKDPDDYRPGTKKGKIDAHPIWLVKIEMPKKLMQDVYIGKENQDHNRMAEYLKYRTLDAVTPENAAQEIPNEPPTA